MRTSSGRRSAAANLAGTDDPPTYPPSRLSLPRISSSSATVPPSHPSCMTLTVPRRHSAGPDPPAAAGSGGQAAANARLAGALRGGQAGPHHASRPGMRLPALPSNSSRDTAPADQPPAQQRPSAAPDETLTTACAPGLRPCLQLRCALPRDTLELSPQDAASGRQPME